MNDQVEMVRLLAYQLWENAGYPEGRHDDFWFAAEAQIRQAFEADAMDKPDGTDAEPAAAAPDAARPSKAA
jgi:hypothetical protein